MYDIAIYMGIATYVCLLVALLSGLRVIKIKSKTHKKIGIIAVIAATIHVSMISYMYLS